MELDNLKDIWKEQPKKEQAEKSDNELLSMLGRQSHLPIAGMKRNLLIELIIIIILFAPVIIYFFSIDNGKYGLVSWVYIFLSAAFFLYYFLKNRLLNKMQCTACHVKSNMQLQVNNLDKYVRMYLSGTTIMIPAILFFFYFFLKYMGKLPVSKGSENTSLLIFGLITLATTILFFYMNKCFIHKLYGKHINSLKRILKQMDDME